nr:hypothetical protein Q903MT_gene1284 [Picea sitchensis]
MLLGKLALFLMPSPLRHRPLNPNMIIQKKQFDNQHAFVSLRRHDVVTIWWAWLYPFAWNRL